MSVTRRTTLSGPGVPPSMRRRTLYPAGWKPELSQKGRDNGLAVSKSTETQLVAMDVCPVERGVDERVPDASAVLASYQRTSALDGGPVQFVDNRHQDALRLRAGHIRLWHVTAYPARPRPQASSPAIRSR